MNPSVLRALGVAIAIAAVWDPAVTTTRSSRPLISLMVSGARDRAVADQVRRALARDFTLIEGALSSSSGAVVIGDGLPSGANGFPGPLFVVRAPRGSVGTISMSTPPTATQNARVPIAMRVPTEGGARGRLLIDVSAGGALVRQDTVPVPEAGATVVRHETSFAPARPGPTEVRVAVSRDDGDPVEAVSVVDVIPERTSVLFHDARPSWMSTFVRRSVESDPRFAVAHRILTSRGTSSTAGEPPPSLSDADALSQYRVIVVGAPDALTEADVGGLDAYLRRRGGRVLLLMDQRVRAPIDRLTTVREWRGRRSAEPVTLDGGEGSLRAREVAWPSTLPAAATVRAVAGDAGVIWSVPVGAGELTLSGALDAWRFRDASSGDFSDWWPALIAELAEGTPHAVDIRIATSVLLPGEETRIDVNVVEALLAPASQPAEAQVSAMLDSTLVRLWPGSTRGHFTGTLVAPGGYGPHRLSVVSKQATGSGQQGQDGGSEAVFLVDSVAASPILDSAIVRGVARSRGGDVFSSTQIDRLQDRMRTAFQRESRVETWHPMRSPWWILPFVLALGGEWWSRRRRGLP
jgi:hypothetical protein